MRDSETDQETRTRPAARVESRSNNRGTESSASRASQVRARHTPRQTTSTRPIVSQAAARSTGTAKLKAARYLVPSRPVVIRGTVSPLPIQKQVTSKTHRRYNVALNTPGAEIRLPTITLGRPGWRILSGLLVIGMLVALYGLIDLPQFQLGSATVYGAQRVTVDDINSALKVSGSPAFLAKPQELTNVLRTAFPEFSMVSVKVGLPASLSVSVVERQPMLAWTQGDTTYWIDQEGYAFPARGDPGVTLVEVQAAGNPPAPVSGAAAADALATNPSTSITSSTTTASGGSIFGRPFLSPSLVAAVIELGAQAPQGTPVVYDPSYGLGWNDPQGWMVYFGSSLSDMDKKLAVYKAIVTQLSQQGITPAMISVEFPDAPFYRMEK